MKRAKVVLPRHQFLSSSSTDCSAYYRHIAESPVLIFQFPRYSARSNCTTKSPDIPRIRIVLPTHSYPHRQRLIYTKT